MLVALFAELMWVEWHAMIDGKPSAASSNLWIGSAFLLGAIITASFDYYLAALVILGIAISLTPIFWRGHVQYRKWLSLGLLYIGIPCLALIALREHHRDGLTMLIWLFGVVWLADTGAYFTGRAIGGPKLAPRLSPNKTWAGFIGGIGTGAIFGAVGSSVMEISLIFAVAASALLALIAELGDLAESAIKRRFNVKDSGALIPGHGGALDRLDSMLFAAPAAVLLLLLIQGGQVWR